jgi:uncharacterized protein (TIGR00725 family)
MERLIAIVGGREAPQELLEQATQVGRLIARSGFGLVCGGMGGIMEAAAKGCKEEGGLTVAILMHDDPKYANPYMDVVIPTGLGIARNLLVVRAGEAVIAIDGSYGTLSEVAFALQMGKPVIGIRTWDVSDAIIKVNSAEEAIKEVLRVLP